MTATTICQINGTFDEVRKTRLPAQCCGEPADQIYKCEQIAPPGHHCRVGDHTILHERMGNGYTCSAVEQQLHERGGLQGWGRSAATSFVRVGPASGCSQTRVSGRSDGDRDERG